MSEVTGIGDEDTDNCVQLLDLKLKKRMTLKKYKQKMTEKIEIIHNKENNKVKPNGFLNN